jgi:hypothetical protein
MATESHALLVAAQIKRGSTGGITTTAIDTAPWMTKKNQRLQIHRYVAQMLEDSAWL